MNIKILDIAVSAALEAGAFLSSRANTSIDYSEAHDIKLRADKDSEALLIDRLQKSYPIVSEESGGVINLDGPTWIVDPLDGTVNYARDLPQSCISIALWERGPILGVIYDFNRDELFTGVVGSGARLNGNTISVSGVASKKDAILFTGFPVATSFEKQPLLDFVTAIQDYRKVRLLGSAALSLAYVACGRGDAYIEHGIRIWDVAAGLAIVQAAGGAFHIHGNDPHDVFADNAAHICMP